MRNYKQQPLNSAQKQLQTHAFVAGNASIWSVLEEVAELKNSKTPTVPEQFTDAWFCGRKLF